MREHTVYTADDGTEFCNEEDCMTYERICNLKFLIIEADGKKKKFVYLSDKKDEEAFLKFYKPASTDGDMSGAYLRINAGGWVSIPDAGWCWTLQQYIKSLTKPLNTPCCWTTTEPIKGDLRL